MRGLPTVERRWKGGCHESSHSITASARESDGRDGNGGHRLVGTGNPVRSEHCSEFSLRLPPRAPHAHMPCLDPRRPVNSNLEDRQHPIGQHVSMAHVGSLHSGAVATGAARLRPPARRPATGQLCLKSLWAVHLVQYSERLGPVGGRSSALSARASMNGWPRIWRVSSVRLGRRRPARGARYPRDMGCWRAESPVPVARRSLLHRR